MLVGRIELTVDQIHMPNESFNILHTTSPAASKTQTENLTVDNWCIVSPTAVRQKRNMPTG